MEHKKSAACRFVASADSSYAKNKLVILFFRLWCYLHVGLCRDLLELYTDILGSTESECVALDDVKREVMFLAETLNVFRCVSTDGDLLECVIL